MNVTSRRLSTLPPNLDLLDEVLQPVPLDTVIPYLFLMSGLPGSGKTTVARHLAARYHALLLSLDEFLVSLYGPSHIVESPAERIHRVKAIREPLWAIARRALRLNISVVLDDGFFSKESRARALFSCTLDDLGGISMRPVIVYCEESDDLLKERLAERSRQGVPFSHHISPELLASFSARFEPPSSGEGMEIIKVSSRSDNESEKPPFKGAAS